MSQALARTARTAHECDTCHWTPSLRGVPTILPGHRYLEHVTFPGDPGFEEGQTPARHKECASHAMERDDLSATQFGICGSYCHGTNPCVLPFEKGSPGHTCSCRECARQDGTS